MAKGIPLRTRIFVGCEGESERSYIRWIQSLADARQKHLFFDPYDAGGGDPFAIVQEAVKKLRQQEKRKTKYAFKAVLLDTDKIGLQPIRDQQMIQLANSVNMKILYQREIHEAILLRHFSGCNNLHPPKQATLSKLKKVWDDYEKPVDAISLRNKLDYNMLCRMLSVEPEFSEFIGILLK